MVQMCFIPRSSNLPHGTRPVHFSEHCHDLVAFRQFIPDFWGDWNSDRKKNIMNTENKRTHFPNTDHLLLQELMLKSSKILTSVFNILIRSNCTGINGIVDRILLTNADITLKEQYHKLYNHQKYHTRMV